MQQKIREHVERLFADAPQSPKTIELKEELILNLIEKYNDLVEKGYDQDEAYNRAILGIGDVRELISGLNAGPALSSEVYFRQKKTNAVFVSISVGLYFLGLLAGIFLEEVLGISDDIAPIAMLGIWGIATCVLVYHFLSRPKYVKREETIVEDFKEFSSKKHGQSGIYKSISALVWTLSVALFFMIGMFFGGFGYAWLIFIIAIPVNQIIKLLFELKK